MSLRSKLQRLDPARYATTAPTPASTPTSTPTSTSTPTPASTSTPTPTPASTSTPTSTATSTATERAETLDELRTRIHAVLARTAPPRPPPPAVETPDLPFLTYDTSLGPLHVRTLHLSTAHRTGRAPVLAARDASSALLSLLALDPTLATCPLRGALYLDTETTGLHGGTGTIAFLVGLAFWSPPTDTTAGELVVEQLLVRNLGEEAPMLVRVAERIRAASMLVTFNGKSFDLPLLRTRFTMAKMPAPEERPHLDLVHVARRLHKVRGIECRLTTIEREVLGFERVGDVPGSEVSACYLHFLRSGDPSALLGVVEHNAWDVVAMAALVGLYGEPLDASALTAEDLVGVARTLSRAGNRDLAFEVASRATLSGSARNQALRARADISKARGDRARAMADFEQLAATVDDPTVRLELAKLYEHHVGAHDRALAVVEQGTGESAERTTKRHRRLTTKIERASKGQRSLFGEGRKRNR